MSIKVSTDALMSITIVREVVYTVECNAIEYNREDVAVNAKIQQYSVSQLGLVGM